MTWQNNGVGSDDRLVPFEGTPAQQSNLEGLQSQIEELRQYIDDRIANHAHGGNEAPQIRLETDLNGLFEVVSVAPSGVPQTVYDQIKIYVNGATKRLYWYDWNANVWHYVTATA